MALPLAKSGKDSTISSRNAGSTSARTPQGAPSTLLDSREYSDARLMGYDGERDPREDGEGLIVRDTTMFQFREITLNGPDGEVRLSGIAEIEQVAQALTAFVERFRAAAEQGRAA